MKALLLSVLMGFVLAACGAVVTTAPQETDAATDGEPSSSASDAPTTTAPPTATTPPPTCPSFRPLRDLPCTKGLSCFFPCAPGYDTSIRATCPSGRWQLENVAACD